MFRSHYDVVIAGAGPAGAAAAIRLNMLNLSVCLVDRIDESKLKAGESLPGAVKRLLAALGIQNLSELLKEGEFENCMANASAWGTEKWTYTDALMNPEGGGWHILRNRFDAALRQKAIDRGVVYVEGQVSKVSSEPAPGNVNEVRHSLTLKNEQSGFPSGITCSWIVDATGRAAYVAKQFEAEKREFDEQVALVSWFKSKEEDRDQTTRVKSLKNGWCYTSRLPGQFRVVSFQGLAQDVSYYKKNPAGFVRYLNSVKILPFNLSYENHHFEMKALKAGVSLLDPVAAPGWIAVGDAALSFDPLSSQGIFFALYSGIKGAETIAAVYHQKNQCKEILTTYSNNIKRVFSFNQRSGKYHYTSELRYKNHPYWQQFLKQPLDYKKQ